MGQQQLLLVILVTIIVGIATVVAINTFGTAADQANIDAVNNDVATLASASQGHYMRPGMLGGGGRTFDGSSGTQATLISFDGLAFPADGLGGATTNIAQNENGRYVLENITAQSFQITANPASCDGYAPGSIADGVLTGGTDCAAGDQIIAQVEPNSFRFGT